MQESIGMADIVPVDTNRSLQTETEQGRTPLLEVHRIIREQGGNIAPKLYEAYEGHFDDPTNRNEAGAWEDPENKVQLKGGSLRRDIRVFIVPPGVQETGYALLGNYPFVAFHYTKGEAGWNYEAATIHGRGGYISTEYTPEKGASRNTNDHFWKQRVRMEDMERALGKYLSPKLPTPQKSSHLHNLISKIRQK